ncbi:hypothetical protein AAEX63_06610 [Luteococcus sp. H138]|uniref:hypothetical protein n=1 Tax=unclassified Luteococcus TaxID=2639923 RepID=UPI00313B008A
MNDERCSGITQSGLQCRRPGSPYCYQHRPPSDSLNFEAHREREDEPAEDQDELFPLGPGRPGQA